jgi:hypothetical protein
MIATDGACNRHMRQAPNAGEIGRGRGADFLISYAQIGLCGLAPGTAGTRGLNNVAIASLRNAEG